MKRKEVKPLKAKQELFLQAMLTESTIQKAMVKAGISKGTAYRYLKDKEFSETLNERRKQCLDDTVRYLQSKLAMCNEKLVEIIENPSTADQVKINAINLVFTACKSLTETADIIGRVDELEAIAREMEQNED